MAASTAQSARGVVWKLSELYDSDEQGPLRADLLAAREMTNQFIASYKGKINDRPLDCQFLLAAIRDFESIHERGLRPYFFASLLQAADTQDDRRNKLLQKMRETWNQITQMLVFLPLEIMALPDDILREAASHPMLGDYQHFLLRLLQRKPYTLSEPEEKLIEEKNLSGRAALTSLYTELMGSLSFAVEVEGEMRELTSTEVLALLHSPDQHLRAEAFRTFMEKLGRHGLIFKSILNALMLDHQLENSKRGHPHPMHKAHLANEVDDAAIETMMAVTEEHYPLARRYFRLKARMLGLDKLRNTDVFAPLNQEQIRFTFEEAKEVVLEAMKNLHPDFHAKGEEFFRKERIDAEIRKGKRDGAFCSCPLPSLHPFILMNYAGNLKDLMTLAHELGHGIHFVLAAKQSFVNFEPSLIMAETASTFIEIVVTQHILQKMRFRNQRLGLLAARIEDYMVTIFRQNVLSRFEQTIHHLRQKGLLSAEEICKYWREANYKLYGEAVEMLPTYAWGWTYIPHLVHYHFYCYTYIFGGLLSNILFQKYLERGSSFLEEIIRLLQYGGSRAPLVILAEMGLDPGKRSFWQEGFQLIKNLIGSLEETAAS